MARNARCMVKQVAAHQLAMANGRAEVSEGASIHEGELGLNTDALVTGGSPSVPSVGMTKWYAFRWEAGESPYPRRTLFTPAECEAPPPVNLGDIDVGSVTITSLDTAYEGQDRRRVGRHGWRLATIVG